jgi:AcrR family transcriptional regulator
MATGAKRAAKAEANRTRLLAEAAAMFHHKGYEAVVMRDVAKAAGISTGGIFSQFANKAALF